LQQPGLFGLRGRVSVLTEGQVSDGEPDGSLGSILELYHMLPQQPLNNGLVGIKVDDLARSAAKQWGSLERFTGRVVIPSLIDRGLYVRESYRILWLITASRLVLTPAGNAARAELEMWLSLANGQFGGWAQQQPNQALAFMGLAGAALFLLPALYPELQGLHREWGSSGFADGGFSFDLGGAGGLDDAFGSIASAVDTGIGEASGGETGGDSGDWGGDGGFDGGGDGGGGC
jgi:hypothetical protein